MDMRESEILPQDVMINDILLRLPAKFIGQFRCVSKQWCYLLSDPHFIKAHLNIHACKEDEKKLIYVSKSRALHSITLNQIPQNGTDGISTKLNLPQLSDNWLRVIGSCNGLILVFNDEMVKYLINPTTLEYRRIPIFYFDLPVPGSYNMSGLGYDFASDDYKVVTLSFYYTDIEHENFDTFVDIYSVRTGIWRRSQSLTYDHEVPMRSSGILVNGALHWLTRKTTNHSFIIVAFDLTDEELLDVPTPITLDKGNYAWIKLVGLRGCLCMFAWTQEINIDIWMMREYTVKESWTIFKITGPNIRYGICLCCPLCSMSDDDVVLDVDGDKLIVYNVKEDQWRYMMVDGITTMFEGTRTFMGSLVSPTFDKDI